MLTVPTLYFDKPGSQNTAQTLHAARERAAQLNVRTILVASTSGQTGAEAAEMFRGYEMVVVGHAAGFAGPNTQELKAQHRAAIEAAGGRVLICQHALGGVNRAVRKKLGTYLTDEIIACTLRVVGEGFKVCLEIALMAADAGLVRVDEPCIAIAGTGRGADTAVVLIPANAPNFFDLKVLEVLAKPRLG